MTKIAIYSRAFRWDDMVLRAIESVQNQTYQNFIHYIEVNDTTVQMIYPLTQKYSNLKIIKNDPTVRIGFLFNAIKLAKESDYLCVLDADDCLAIDFFEKQLNFIKEHDLDISCCSVSSQDEDGKSQGNIRCVEKDIVIKQKDVLGKIDFFYDFFRAIWGKLFAAKLFTESMWDDFPSNDTHGGYGGDTRAALELLKNTKKIGITKEVGYYYTLNSKSTSHRFEKGRENADVFALDTLRSFFLHYTNDLAPEHLEFMFKIYLGEVSRSLKLVANIACTQQEKLDYTFLIFEKSSVSEATKFFAGNSKNNLKLKYYPRESLRKIRGLYSFLFSIKFSFLRKNMKDYYLLFDALQKIHSEQSPSVNSVRRALQQVLLPCFVLLDKEANTKKVRYILETVYPEFTQKSDRIILEHMCRDEGLFNLLSI